MDEIQFPMFIPDANRLAQVLRKGLTSNFAEFTVEWVNCPDLTQKPFKLTAPGLCGNTTILQVGGTGNMFPWPQTEKSYKIVDLVKLMKRHCINSFVIGGCICPRPMTIGIGELSVDMLCLPIQSDPDVFQIRNQCRLASWNSNRDCLTMQQLFNFEDHKCTILGNFFVSEGKTGQVLKVQAKKRIGLDFIDAIQSALCQEFSGEFPTCIGLGGTFMVKNARVKHHVIPDIWYCPIPIVQDIHKWLWYFDINAPMIVTGMFVNTNQHMVASTKENNIKKVFLTTKQFHTFHDTKGGYYHREFMSSDTVEYLGYFSPAEKMFLIDPNVNSSVPEMSVVRSCW